MFSRLFKRGGTGSRRVFLLAMWGTCSLVAAGCSRNEDKPTDHRRQSELAASNSSTSQAQPPPPAEGVAAGETNLPSAFSQRLASDRRNCTLFVDGPKRRLDCGRLVTLVRLDQNRLIRLDVREKSYLEPSVDAPDLNRFAAAPPAPSANRTIGALSPDLFEIPNDFKLKTFPDPVFDVEPGKPAAKSPSKKR